MPQCRVEIAVHDRRVARHGIQCERRVLLRCDERVLCIRNQRRYNFCRPRLRRDSRTFHHALDDGDVVVLIVDREVRSATNGRRVGSQQTCTDGVKRSTPHPLGLITEQAGNSLAHLARSLVRERHGEDPRRINPMMLDEPRDASGEYACLSGASSGKDEHRSFEMQYRLSLGRVQSGEGLSINSLIHVPELCQTSRHVCRIAAVAGRHVLR